MVVVLTVVATGQPAGAVDRDETRPAIDGVCASPTGARRALPHAKAPISRPAATPATAPALPPVQPFVLSRVAHAGRRIALTFDACSSEHGSRYDAEITRVLTETKTPATIFLGGDWAHDEKEIVRELAANPEIELGNHTWSHAKLTSLPPEGIKSELERTQSEIYALTGQVPKYFRPPYGEYNARVVEEAAKLGLTTVEFNLASGDPDKHFTRERLVEWVLKKAMPGSIIVMHINRRGWHTAEALPDIIAGLRERGYELVTVGELLKHGRPIPAAAEVLTVAGTGVHHKSAKKASASASPGAG
jgi:peptidoglycan/xylan/chitin deacetylase (PgdA/CDA1 family)